MNQSNASVVAGVSRKLNAFPLRSPLELAGSRRASIYLLEDSKEFDRLEEQERKEGYRCADDLGHLSIPAGATVLDAGCGSGVVARYIASRFPGTKIIGCDKTLDRVNKATLGSASFKNIEFKQSDLTSLGFADDTFDFIVCRYVIHHFPNDDGARMEALSELYRCLKPGGQITFVEPSSMFYDLNNQTEHVRDYLAEVRASGIVDLEVGKYLPTLLEKSGFTELDWNTKIFCSRKQLLAQEHKLMADRLELIRGALSKQISGGSARFDRFRDEFLSAFWQPDTIYYAVGVIATARKTSSGTL